MAGVRKCPRRSQFGYPGTSRRVPGGCGPPGTVSPGGELPDHPRFGARPGQCRSLPAFCRRSDRRLRRRLEQALRTSVDGVLHTAGSSSSGAAHVPSVTRRQRSDQNRGPDRYPAAPAAALRLRGTSRARPSSSRTPASGFPTRCADSNTSEHSDATSLLPSNGIGWSRAVIIHGAGRRYPSSPRRYSWRRQTIQTLLNANEPDALES